METEIIIFMNEAILYCLLNFYCILYLQTNDLNLVLRGVKFSCFYTLENLEARWAGILLDPAISKVTQSAIQKLHPKVVQSVYRKALFSKDEHALLRAIKGVSCLCDKGLF
jgi:microspherule protein 1